MSVGSKAQGQAVHTVAIPWPQSTDALELKEASRLHGSVNSWKQRISLLSANLKWRILWLPTSWTETITLSHAWRHYIFLNQSRVQISDPSLLTPYVYKTEGNCLQNGAHQLQPCLYLLALLPTGVSCISPPLESGLVWWLAFSNRMRRKWHNASLALRRPGSFCCYSLWTLNHSVKGHS